MPSTYHDNGPNMTTTEPLDIPIHSRVTESLAFEMRYWQRQKLRGEAGHIRDALMFYHAHLRREELLRDQEFLDRREG